MAENVVVDPPKLIRVGRGVNSRALVHLGYKYELKKKRNTGYFRRCCRPNCCASVKTNVVDTEDLNSEVHIIGHNQLIHNHGNDSLLLEKMGIVDQMKNDIINNATVPLKQAYNDVVTHSFRNAGNTGIPLPTISDFESVRSSLQRTKNQLCPPLPRNINEVKFPEHYAETYLSE